MVGHPNDKLNFSQSVDVLSKDEFADEWNAACREAKIGPPPEPRKPRPAPGKYTELVMAWVIMLLIFIGGWLMADLFFK